MKDKINIILNSAILYIIAFLTTTIIHEFAHALAGLVNNSDPILHHNYVQHFSSDSLGINQLVFIALAGPVTSLVQGLITGWLFIKSKEKKLIHLFLLWFSVLGFNNFLGYLMTGPIFKAGDIGKVYQLLNFSVFGQIILAVLGAAALLFIAYKITRPFLEFSYEQKWVNDRKTKKDFSFHILILPWIIGSAIITLLYMPIIALVSIIYPIMSGMIFIFPWQNAQRIENIRISKHKKIGQFSLISFFILVIMMVLFKFVLAPGIQF